MADVVGFWKWDGWGAIGAIGTIVAAFALMAAVWAIVLSRRATQLAASIDLLREYRSKEMRAARKRILALDLVDRHPVLENFDDGDREAIGHALIGP